MTFHIMDLETLHVEESNPNGTSWGYSSCALDIIGNSKLTLDVIDINGLSKSYSILMEPLFERTEKWE
jgi:hypothetical protein